MASSDHRWHRWFALPVAALVLAGCGGSGGHKQAGGLFDDQDQATITCMKHQKEEPGKLYTGGPNADTGHILEMMQYFTSYGDKPYCDGKPATAIDATWAQLYVSLGGEATKVGAVLAKR